MTPLSLVLLTGLLTSAQATAPKRATAAEAKAFVHRVNEELFELTVREQTAAWIQQTYITDDTDRNHSEIEDEFLAYTGKAAHQAVRFQGLKLDPDTQRMLSLLRLINVLPAPADPVKRARLAELSTTLTGLYGKGVYCGKDGKGGCRDLLSLSDTLEKSRNYDELLEAWNGWHSIARPMRPLFEEIVSLANEGAKEIGYQNLADLWRSNYDMPPAAFEQETGRLWKEVKPLYDSLHCYVRSRLAKVYGADRVPAHGPIPAHLLGNMWAQDWTSIYPLVEPYPGEPDIDVTAALVRQKYDGVRMVKLAESFFTSLGLVPLPATFWQRSLFKKPQDREVVCHASAWDITMKNDLRLKACLKINDEDLLTAHHELGHLYYYHAYDHLPVLFQQGANDGFHEAIGDTISLSVTPSYLKRVGILQQVGTSEKALINQQLKDALNGVAFLPFGKLIDQWRWEVFSGKVPPSRYNARWWELRREYQGVSAPSARSEADFDPGAKYHVASNTPYMRYFLARILQFQFHRALCQTAGFQGPLHACSIYGSKAAGQRLENLLELGASRPWPEALEVLTGRREMDPGALLEYFAPLRAWLEKQNQGQTCGW